MGNIRSRTVALGVLACTLAACQPQQGATPAADPAPSPSPVDAGPATPSPSYTEEVEAYRAWVQEQVAQLQIDVQAFAAAIQAGRIDDARRLYAGSRQGWERIEPVAELFPDLDRRMDARADDFKLAEADPEFSGWHRLEHAMFTLQTLEGMAPFAAQLVADAAELQARLPDMDLPPSAVVGGAAELVEEVAAGKISGEENRYAGTDLWDIQANMEGARRIVELFRARIAERDAGLLAGIEEGFEEVDGILAAYRSGDGWAHYSALNDRDRNSLRGVVNHLAEQLALLRGTLHLD